MTNSNIKSPFRFCHVRITGKGLYELWGCPTQYESLICDRLHQLGASSTRPLQNGIIRFRAKSDVVKKVMQGLPACPLTTALNPVKILPSGTRLIAA